MGAARAAGGLGGLDRLCAVSGGTVCQTGHRIGLGGAAEMPYAHLKIWHGLVPALYMSIAARGGWLDCVALFSPLLAHLGSRPAPRSQDHI